MYGDSRRTWWRQIFSTLRNNTRSKGDQRSRRFLLRLEGLEHRTVPAVANLSTVADDTLYQVSTATPSQQLSNGAGQFFFVGETSQGANAIRRGAIKFDLSAVPAGSTITSVTLTLNMSKTRNGPENITLHRALMNWGEGASKAGTGGQGAGEGDGVQATTGDVTWFFTSFATQTWSTPGGDFVAAPSASTSVNNVGTYQWGGAGLVADVQEWLNNPAANFGWIVTGNESSGGTSKQFDTKENSIPADRPVLTINYTPPVPDLTISKTHSGAFHQGDAADTYTITVKNLGSGPTTGQVKVTDVLPAGLSPTAADAGTINGWTVTTSGQTIAATRSDALAGGANYPAFDVAVAVSATAPPSVTNIATVAGGGEVNTTNDTASDATTITQVADLTIAKTHATAFRQGDGADIYTLTANNIGPASTTGAVTVNDTLPAGLAPTAADAGNINGWSVTTNGQTITATRSDALAAGASYPPLILTVAVSPTAAASVTNIATVAGGGEVDTANDSASDITAIAQVADLTLTKTHTGTFHPGDSAATYTITVSNVGAAPTSGQVTVTDTLPAGLAPTAADAATINGWTVTTSGQTVTATRADTLAAGGNYPPLIVTASVADNVASVVTNTAAVSGGGEVNLSNDTASDITATTQVPDLTLTKTHATAFHQGDAADIYTLTVSNTGLAATTGPVSVTDTLPGGLTPTLADSGTVNGWIVTTSGQTVTAARSDTLAPDASFPTLPLTVKVAATAAASVTNIATVAGGGEVDTANDSASDITAIAQVADLTLTKTHTGTFHPGDSAATYTITVSNVGAAPTSGQVTVTDTLPAGLAPTAADAATINGWTVTTSGQTVTATRADTLAAGGSFPILTLRAKVAATAPPNVTNTATVAGGGEVNSANDTASDATTITPVADLTIAVSRGGNFSPEGTAAYTIVVRNIGRGATNAPVTVVNLLPAGLAYIGPTSVNGWSLSVSGQKITATRSDPLASAASYPPLTLAVSVTGNAPTSLTDSATVAGGGEINFGNNSAFDILQGLSPRRRGA